ncbi:MAG: hypothetical protein NT004_02920 [Bacteroidetes bacterium]|nr:hypothetical protein [Bacteroidota bacterium]
MKAPLLDKTIEIIYKELSGIIAVNNYSEYSAKKIEVDKVTQTVFRTYNGEKLSRLVLEQYTINSKAYGVVLTIYPQPEYGIPIFTFQLGGQIPERVIFVLDMIPVINSDAISPVSSLYNKYASEMKNLGTSQEWMNKIASRNALVCQYKPLEPDKILSSLTDYLQLWREKYYLPAEPITVEDDKKAAIETILMFKKTLQANDAGIDIYRKKFGEAMVAALENAAFGAYPSLEISVENENLPAIPLEISAENDSPVKWTDEAEQYLEEAPKFVRSKIRTNAEKKAMELGIKRITREFVENLRK